MIKIALYQPLIPDMNLIPQLGLLYIAAVLEKENFEVIVFDERTDQDSEKKIIDFHPDVLGITAVTPGYNRGLRLSEKIKHILPDARVVFGGPHAAILPKQVLSNNSVDYVITGEGEFPFLELCRCIALKNESEKQLSKINNLGYKNSAGKITINPLTPFLSGKELDELPFPAYHTMDIDAYFKRKSMHGLFQKGKRILPLMSSRGCPFTCTFCNRVMGKKMRFRSPANVMKEINYLIKNYSIDELYIEDDNFTIDRARAIELLQLIAESDLHYLKFANGLNVNMMDDELLQYMKKAGVYALSFGIESGNTDTLKRMDKKNDLVRAKKIINSAKKMNFFVGANCIIGYPDESIEDIRKSLKYFCELNLDSMAIVNLVPFPGTEARNICKKKGYLTAEAEDWDNYYFSINKPIPLIETPVLSKNELIKEIKRAYRKIYFFNLKWLFKSIRNLSFYQIWLGIKIFFGLNK